MSDATERFEQSLRKTYADGLALIARKNADYANPEDPFKNFRSAGVAGVGVDRAILARVLYKMSRISNLLGREAVVMDEKIEDTLLDCINYLAILKAYIESNGEI